MLAGAAGGWVVSQRQAAPAAVPSRHRLASWPRLPPTASGPRPPRTRAPDAIVQNLQPAGARVGAVGQPDGRCSWGAAAATAKHSTARRAGQGTHSPGCPTGSAAGGSSWRRLCAASYRPNASSGCPPAARLALAPPEEPPPPMRGGVTEDTSTISCMDRLGAQTSAARHRAAVCAGRWSRRARWQAQQEQQARRPPRPQSLHSSAAVAAAAASAHTQHRDSPENHVQQQLT